MANLFSRFLGRTASEGAAFALGVATGPVLAPAVEDVKNEAWRAHQSRTLDAGTAAEIVAEDVERRDWGANEASAHGISGSRFDAMLGAVLNAPGMGELLQARRRGLITDAEFRHGLRKAKLEGLWDTALFGLLDVLLTPAELANARQQGYIGQARQYDEAAKWGIDNERAEIQFEMVGLPPGVAEALTMLRRGIINEATFAQIVREGHTKTKYTDELLELRNIVLSPSTYATLHLKGHISEAAMIAGGELSGASADYMRDLYLSMGNPAATGQMWTAAARGINGPDGRPVDEAQFLKAIAQSRTRPEYGPMLWAIRYLYPPLFQLSRLVTSGVITPAVGAEWATKARYAPEVVDALKTSWSQAGAGAVGAWERKAETQLWTATHKGFINGEVDEPRADAALASIGITKPERDAVLRFWNEEKNITVKPLTPSQIKRAYKENQLSLDDAIARLELQHYTDADARTYLTT